MDCNKNFECVFAAPIIQHNIGKKKLSMSKYNKNDNSNNNNKMNYNQKKKKNCLLYILRECIWQFNYKMSNKMLYRI